MSNTSSKLDVINKLQPVRLDNKQEQIDNKQERPDNKTGIAHGLTKKEYMREYMLQYNRKKKEKEQQRKQEREQLLRDVANIFIHLINVNLEMLPLEVQAEIRYLCSRLDKNMDELVITLCRIINQYIIRM